VGEKDKRVWEKETRLGEKVARGKVTKTNRHIYWIK
jgi:hypothetical protein